MAYSVILSDGTTNYQFVYDPASQANYKMYYGMRVASGETRAQWHQPDDATRQLIRLVDDPGTIYITQTVKGGAAWDNVINNIVPIKRLVNGRHQQAARYQLDGDVNKVYCRIQIDGATNYTDYEVIYGEVDDSGSYYKSVDVANTEATGVIIALNVKPYGTGAAITLRNDLASSPHFIEANTSATLADGWNDQGTPTRSIASTIYLIGGKTQRVETDNSTTEGISSDTVAAGSGVNFVAYCWVYVQSGDQVTVQVRNGAATVLASKTVTTAGGANYDKSAAAQGSAAGSGVFYRLSFSSTTVNTNGVQLYIIRATGDATQTTVFFVDGAYVQLNTTTIPGAWCSTSAIYNRYDPTSSNEERINYLDVWGVPGDSDALVTLKVGPTNVTSDQTGWTISKVSDGKYLAAELGCVYGATHAGWTYTAGFTSTADADALGGTARQNNTGTGAVATLAITGADAQKFLSKPRRIFVLAETGTSPSASTIDMVAYIEVATLARFNYEITKTADILASGEYKWIDLGAIDTSGVVPFDVPVTANINITIEIDYNRAGTETLKFSGIYAMPIEQEDGLAILVVETPTDPFWLGNGDGSLIDGRLAMTRPYTGKISTVKPGVMTRFYFSSYDGDTDDYYHNITGAFTVTAVVTPRTRHLLGTS